MALKWCTHDRCDRDELHEEHQRDFTERRGRPIAGTAPERVRRTGRTKAERIARYSPPVRLMTPSMSAYVDCPECRGGGCGLCAETGLISLYQWHLWKNNC